MFYSSVALKYPVHAFPVHVLTFICYWEPAFTLLCDKPTHFILFEVIQIIFLGVIIYKHDACLFSLLLLFTFYNVIILITVIYKHGFYPFIFHFNVLHLKCCIFQVCAFLFTEQDVHVVRMWFFEMRQMFPVISRYMTTTGYNSVRHPPISNRHCLLKDHWCLTICSPGHAPSPQNHI